jgi:hypothetical protein
MPAVELIAGKPKRIRGAKLAGLDATWMFRPYSLGLIDKR